MHSGHGLHSEIDDHLLQLDPISTHWEKAPLEFQLHRNLMPKRFVPQERDRLFEDLVDV